MTAGLTLSPEPCCPNCGETPMFRSQVHACCERIERVMALRRPDDNFYDNQRHIDYLTGWNACLLSVRNILAPTKEQP